MVDNILRKPISICIITQNKTIPRWIAELIEQFTLKGLGRITHHFINKHQRNTHHAFRWLESVSIYILNAMEERFYAQQNFALKPESLDLLIKDTFVISKTLYSINELPVMLDGAGEKRPDVILNFTSEMPHIRNSYLPFKNFFSVQNGVYEPDRFPAGLPEVGLNEGIIQSYIISGTDISGEITGNRVTSTVNASAYYYTVHNHFCRLSHRLQEVIRHIHESGDSPEHQFTDLHGIVYRKGQWYEYSFLFILRYYLRKTRKWFNLRLFNERWILLFSDKGWDQTLKNPDFLRKIVPPKNTGWADPFLLQHDNRLYVLYEEIPAFSKKGHLNISELSLEGHLTNTHTILNRDYHLSYPYIFKHNDTWYMIPESSANKTIDLYKCASFPKEWNFECTLMKHMEANDTSIIFYNGKFWLFTVIKKSQNKWNYDDLFVFYSDSLTSGTWISHPRNPVVSDPRFARPAGRLFMQDNNLFRVAQNCSYRYGYGIELFMIETLDEYRFHERHFYSLRPWKNNISGIHTFNHVNNYVILDAKVKKAKWW